MTTDPNVNQNRKKITKSFNRFYKKLFKWYSIIPLEIIKWRLNKNPRYQPGKISVLNWSIEYLDAPALVSSIDLLLIKKSNDFKTSNPIPVILDCGANIGISVLNYKRKFPNSQIIAFEPDPIIIPILKKNLKVNGASDVKIVEAAVWIKNGKSKFFCEGADGSKLIHHTNSHSTIEVSTIDLKDYISQPIDLIKMDIEGAEFDVIPHLSNKLHCIQNILIECHINSFEIEKFSMLLNELGKAGFQVSIGVLGNWSDLLNKPIRIKNGFDQYILVSAWRDEHHICEANIKES